jgi:hypothetical protein
VRDEVERWGKLYGGSLTPMMTRLKTLKKIILLHQLHIGTNDPTPKTENGDCLAPTEQKAEN